MKRNAPLQLIMRAFSRVHGWIYQKSNGRLGAKANGEDVLLLFTKGRKTGHTRVTPLTYYPDADRYVLIAASAGADRNPGWYLNLRDNPDVTVQMKGTKRKIHATTVTDPAERERLWQKVLKLEDSERGYEWTQSQTERQFPVVVLSSAE